ncbi:MAG: lactate racemase domain-containing protein [Myxococcaceae bacterium]
MPRPVLFSGFDLVAPELPADARILNAPPPLDPLGQVKESAKRALEAPVSGAALSRRVHAHSRVAVVVDDLSLPVPPLNHDCRRELLEAVLDLLAEKGLTSKRVTVLIANGLSRQWRMSELTDALGIQVTAAFPPICHDAEAQLQLTRIADEPEGPIEFNRALIDCDLVVHVNLVTTPLHAGLYPIAAGATSYRTQRMLNHPSHFEEHAPLQPGSSFHRAHERVTAALQKRVPVMQLSAVLNNDVYAPSLSAMLRSEKGLSRSLQVWNAMPNAVRHRAARLLRANYQPIAVVAGPPEAVGPQALGAFYRQHEREVEGDAQVVIFGLPDQGPGSVGSAQNPILSANLALGYVMNLFTHKPLLQEGGVIIFANPLAPSFDKVHLPQQEFYEKVLRLERDPTAIAEKYEPYFAGKPEFVANYQKNYAFHGAHPLYAWAMCNSARQRAARIIVAHGDPRACARLGFTPATNIEDALHRAKEALADAQPSVAVMELPPPYWVRVN